MTPYGLKKRDSRTCPCHGPKAGVKYLLNRGRPKYAWGVSRGYKRAVSAHGRSRARHEPLPDPEE